MDGLTDMLRPLDAPPYAQAALVVLALLLAAWLANWITRRILLRLVAKMLRATPGHWDDALLGRGVLARLANVVPALVVYAGIVAVREIPPSVQIVVRNVALAFVALTLALALSNLLNAVNDLYERNSRHARERPIKGYLQLAKIVVFVLTAVIVVAILIERSPWLLLSGFGAMSAVVLLVFKDTILSLVASVQLTSNNMLRVGDWIEMPSLGADGDVIDMALNTVKVQNWDKTITTIPTYRLISESFKNWRGMQESGGRRIKRALLIDQTSVRFLTREERDGFRRVALIDDYLNRKREELEEYNATLEAAGKDPINTRRVTNLGTFRAYVRAYLQAHPRVNQDMTLLVRQLAPGPTGLPLEIYCFTDTTQWKDYEDIQSDIFDHLFAVLPEFGLRLYQQPAGVDLVAAVRAVAGGAGPAAERPGGEPAQDEEGLLVPTRRDGRVGSGTA